MLNSPRATVMTISADGAGSWRRRCAGVLAGGAVFSMVASFGAGSPSAWSSSREDAGVPVVTFALARAQRDYSLACAQFARVALRRGITPRRPRSLRAARKICVRSLRSADKDLNQQRRASLAETQVVNVRVKPGRARVTVQSTLYGLQPRSTGTVIVEHGRWKIRVLPGGAHVGRTLVEQVSSTSSMLPTLNANDTILIDQDAYRDAPPLIGDIVVLHPPALITQRVDCAKPPPAGQACATPFPLSSKRSFIKRIVAGPGDRISIRDGHVIRNGAPAPEDFITPCAPTRLACDFPRSFTVAAGHYYVLGDNRGASYDSRYWGPIAPTAILGRVRRLGP